jgi:hypothetical protein
MSSSPFLEMLNPNTTHSHSLSLVQNLLPSKAAEVAVLNIQEVPNLNRTDFSGVFSVAPDKQFQFITY